MLGKIIEYTGFAFGCTLICLAAWDYVSLYINALLAVIAGL